MKEGEKERCFNEIRRGGDNVALSISLSKYSERLIPVEVYGAAVLGDCGLYGDIDRTADRDY